MRLHGGRQLATTSAGELEVTTALGAVRFSKPVAYQIIDGARHDIDVAYGVDHDTYAFALGPYDRSEALVIDPILAATFAGGSQGDEVSTLVADGAGTIYIAGSTSSPDFPGVDVGSADQTQAGIFTAFLNEAFVAQLDSGLTTVLNATFLGGSDSDRAFALALGSDGSVYVGGQTYASDFPGVSTGAADPTFVGLYSQPEGFVAKLDSTLSSIQAATYMGGSRSDRLTALVLDGAGNVYVGGDTSSVDFPGVGAGSADAVCEPYSDIVDCRDGFVARLNSSLTSLLDATYLGGHLAERSLALALDGDGSVYVAGQTESSNFPGITVGSAVPTYAGAVDGFVAKLDSTLDTVLAATYLGGSNNDYASAITLDGSGNAYVAGTTRSQIFSGVNASSADSSLNDGSGGAAALSDVFVAKLNAKLSSVLAATYLGGSQRDFLARTYDARTYGGLVLGRGGDVYVTGVTESSDFPRVSNDSADKTFAGDDEAFVAHLDKNLGTIHAATFLGGSSSDAPSRPISSLGRLYVGGRTASQNFPGVDGDSADPNFNDEEGFVTEFGACSLIPSPWVYQGGPLDACTIGDSPVFDPEWTLSGCEIVDCCPGCPGIFWVDWEIYVRGEALRSVIIRFEGLSAEALRRVEIAGNARWIGTGRLLVPAAQRITLRGLPGTRPRSGQGFKATAERVTFEQPELFNGRASIDITQSVGGRIVARDTLQFVGGR